MALSTKSINVVKATAPVVAEHALEITRTFYNTMFKNNPEVKEFFNAAHQVGGRQPRALADSVIQYALHIDDLGALGDLVTKIAHRHCALSVLPVHYPIVHSNLMHAIGEVLGDAVTPEIAEGWSEAVSFLAQVCIDAEEGVYKAAEARTGGWRLQREFEVEKKTNIADDTVQLRFKPTDGYDGTFEYDPGQYITVRIPETDQAPRHYCLVEKPNADNALEVAVRREGGGLYSNYIHDELQEGHKVLLGAPMGVFKADPGFDGNIAWVAGGVGAAPMRSFLHEYGDQVKAGVVVNKTTGRTVYRDEFEAADADIRFFNTEDGRPNLDDQADFLIDATGVDGTYFLCGPTSLMAETDEILRAKGCTDVRHHVYGTGTISTNLESAKEVPLGQCPMGYA